MTKKEAIRVLLDFYVVEYDKEWAYGVARTPGELTDEVMEAWGVLRKSFRPAEADE